MNKNIRKHVASLFLLLPATTAMLALPGTALAQQGTPEVRSLEIASDAGLQAGARLTFTVVGTPRAEGEIRVRGLRDPIELTETSRGVYVGRYTIRRGDRPMPDTELEATLRSGKRSSSSRFALSEVMGRDRALAPPPPARAPEPQLRIERFGMAQVERLEPGAELRFSLEGAPGAIAIVDLPGVQDNLSLREMRPGHYEGTYTVRRADRLNPNEPVVATLRLGDRAVKSSLALPLAAATRMVPPVLVQPPVVVVPAHPLGAEIVSHPAGSDIGTDPVRIIGRSVPHAIVSVTVHATPPAGVVLRDLPPILVRETVQADAEGSFYFTLVPQIPFPGVRYDIIMLSTRGNAREETRTTLFQRS